MLTYRVWATFLTTIKKEGHSKLLHKQLRRKSTLNLSAESENYHGMIDRVKKLESKGLPIVHHHGYVCDLPIKHRFAMRKFHGVMRYLKTDNVISSKQVLMPSLIDSELVMTVHTRDYIERFLSGETTKDEQRMTGFVWSEGIVSRCRYETGGTLLASRVAMERGVACSTGGGTHHAFPSYGSGYCLINDIAVTAAVLREEGKVGKVLVVDLDVHQGDGTAFIFQDNQDIFTFSMHCERNFPQRKQHSDLDIGLDNGMEDKEYILIRRIRISA